MFVANHDVKPWAVLLCLQLFFCLNMVFQHCYASIAAQQCWLLPCHDLQSAMTMLNLVLTNNSVVVM